VEGGTASGCLWESCVRPARAQRKSRNRRSVFSSFLPFFLFNLQQPVPDSFSRSPPLRSIALVAMAKYTKFGSPDAEESAPKASTSKLAPASQPPPPSSSSFPAPSPSNKKRPRSSSLTNGFVNGNGQAHHNHTVSYHQSDEEDELSSKQQRQQQPFSKKKRRREGSLTNGAGGAGGDTAAEKAKRRAVAEKLRKERMELPIWAGEF